MSKLQKSPPVAYFRSMRFGDVSVRLTCWLVKEKFYIIQCLSVLIEAKTKPHQPIRDEDIYDSAKMNQSYVQSQKIYPNPNSVNGLGPEWDVLVTNFNLDD